MKFSKHAIKRCQQRGITRKNAELVKSFGKYYWHKGAKVFYLTARQIKKLLKEKVIQAQQADKLCKIFVVYSEDKIITTFHPSRFIRLSP